MAVAAPPGPVSVDDICRDTEEPLVLKLDALYCLLRSPEYQDGPLSPEARLRLGQIVNDLGRRTHAEPYQHRLLAAMRETIPWRGSVREWYEFYRGRLLSPETAWGK